MTQEQKDLLLKDLCARLPYGVKVMCGAEKSIFEVEAITSYSCVCPKDKNYLHNIDNDEIKPCLFPLSSMTEEQFQELTSFNLTNCAYSYEVPFKFRSVETFSLPVLEWFLKHHFDINGLLEKGLAINATGLNIY